MKKILSYCVGLSVALLAIAPPLNYNIPTMVNSFAWCYAVIVSGFLGMFLLSRDLPALLKALAIYLWVSCFFSSVPYYSFNAYILAVSCFYFFIGARSSERSIVLNAVTAAFWLQVFMVVAQLCGKDTLLNFQKTHAVFFGTVNQYMRFSSLLAVTAPLLMLKSKWYLVPIGVLVVMSKSSSFGLAVIAGIVVYLCLTFKKGAPWVILSGILGMFAYILWDRASFEIAITDGRIPVWVDIAKSWVMDTSKGPMVHLSGPIDWKSIFFGRGMDTFLPLFPVMKHDPNPFPQCHMDYLQFLWEIGLVGTTIFMGYCVNLVRKLYQADAHIYIAGLVCIAVNMTFAFPCRMTQTVLMMLCFLALCEKKLREDMYA